MFTLESGFKKLQIRMLDSPDTCGRKPYPEKLVPGSQIVGRARKSGEDANVKGARKAGRSGKEGSSSRFFSSSPLSQFRGLDYLGAWNRLYPERKTCGFKNIRIRVTGPQEANINPKHRRCLVIRLGHRLTLSHRRLMTTPVNRHFLEKYLPR